MNIIKKLESNVFKAISEEIRLRIAVLLSSGELCVCDLMQVLNLPQSSVSRHIAKLKSVHLVTDRRDKKWVYYQINNNINEIIPSLTEILIEFRNREPFATDKVKLETYLQTKCCD